MAWKSLIQLSACLFLAACATSAQSDTSPSSPDGDAAAAVDAASAATEAEPTQGMQQRQRTRAGASGEGGQGMRQAQQCQGGQCAGQNMRGQGRQQGQHQMQGRRGQGMHQGQGMRRGMGGQGSEAAEREVPAELQEGARLFEYICTQCHTLDPPANLAPPMTHVARHLRQSFSEEAEAVAFIRSYVPAPDAEQSVMPAMAVERFGLMPPLPLPAELLDEIARYVWYLGS